MTCPSEETLMLVAMEVVTGDAAEAVVAHARDCNSCRQVLAEARRGHIERMRRYEAFDHDHDRLREEFMAMLPANTTPRAACGRVSGWWHALGDGLMLTRTVINRRATAMILAPAACIIIAVLLVLANGERNVFANALAQFRDAQTIVCHVKTTIKVRMAVEPRFQEGKAALPGKDQLKPTETVRDEVLYLSDTQGVRRDVFEGGKVVSTSYTSDDGSTLMLNRSDRTYQEFDIDEKLRQVAADSPGPDVHFMSLAQNPDRLLRGVQDLTLEAESELGRERLEDRELIGYAIPAERVGLGAATPRQPNGNRAELWVDGESGMADRLVFDFTTRIPGTKKVPLKASITMRIVYDRFEWDPPLAPDWFAPVIPDDYTPLARQGMFTHMTMPDEADLIEALRVFGELAGRYPANLNAMNATYEVSFVLGSVQAKRIVAKREGKPVAALPDTVAIGKKLQGLALYTLLDVQGRRPEYFGTTVKPGDKDAVLMRWALEDGRTRVIYGDLRIRTLTEQP